MALILLEKDICPVFGASIMACDLAGYLEMPIADYMTNLDKVITDPTSILTEPTSITVNYTAGIGTGACSLSMGTTTSCWVVTYAGTCSIDVDVEFVPDSSVLCPPNTDDPTTYGDWHLVRTVSGIYSSSLDFANPQCDGTGWQDTSTVWVPFNASLSITDFTNFACTMDDGSFTGGGTIDNGACNPLLGIDSSPPCIFTDGTPESFGYSGATAYVQDCSGSGSVTWGQITF